MSASAQRRVRTGSTNSGSRAPNMQDFAMAAPSSVVMKYFEPCAATASMFLYAQGNSVVCCHHDTLTIERRFARHSEEVQLLAVDTQSETGAGRLVVSYDAGQTAIVWDLMTGDEVARFASYETLTCAAWMRNGNVAFGNTQGNIILFEPTTSEHISARTIDQIAVTALAPAADCRTFAIGYQNGSTLIATLQPRFTILHNLSTSRGPSSIVTLSWHASSSRQKSDMLSVQTNDGDLRVWSVTKSYSNEDPAKVVRILKKTENYLTGPNWMSWSKNGRIIQFSESETLSWDVRTKHVTFDSIPTLEHIRGLAVYGPGATLFTLGANNTVQQFDLNAPAMMVANVQHPANLLPPSPPISLEEQEKGMTSASESESIAIEINADVSASEDERMSPLARLVRGRNQAADGDVERYRTASPASSHSRSSVSQSSTSSRTPGHRYPGSIASRGMSENTYISTGSSMRSSAVPHQDRHARDSVSVSSMSSVSMTSSHNRPGRHRPSRLRNEVPRSPEDTRAQDLFKFTRSRLSDIPYKHPVMPDTSRLTNDDLRHQMLSVIFGWNREMDDLVRDEMSRHPAGSTSRILLAKWLGDIDSDIMATGAENMTSSDWMLLALSGIGGQASQHKLGRAYIQRLLENGDVHAAATIMLGMGDHNDAIEIYISHKRYMEALILTCLFFPGVWERQSQIIKKWGEWAVQHGQQQLAIRCFACTGKESSEPWTSPSAVQTSFPNIAASIPEVLSPPLSPPGFNRGPQRSIAKTSALKLITSFDTSGAKSKFFAGDLGGPTPIAAGVTPIAESALSPRGRSDPTTALLNPSTRSQFNTPASARPPHGGFNRQRLPSIGEAPNDITRDLLTAVEIEADPLETQLAQGRYGETHLAQSRYGERAEDNAMMAMKMGRAATASPQMMRDTQRRRDPPPPSPSPQSLAMLMEGGNRHNGPRSRIPDGLDLHLEAVNENAGDDITSPEPSVASSTRFHWPTRRRGPGSVASSVTSAASSVARSHRGERSRHHTSGRTLDDYIHSLDSASTTGHSVAGQSVSGQSVAGQSTTGSTYSKRRIRASSRDSKQRGREVESRDLSRGRTESRGFTPKGAKRSPTSPIPMSPEDLIQLTTPKLDHTRLDDDGMPLIDIEDRQPSTVKKVSSRTVSRTSSRATSRDRRDRRPPALQLRGRSGSRASPTSPVPMSAGGGEHFYGSEDEEDYRLALEARERFRAKKTGGRSTSRGRIAGEAISPGSVQERTDRSRSRPRQQREPLPSPEYQRRASSAARHGAGELRSTNNDRQAKKEAAARELEARRRSLARRPTVPAIPHPNQYSPALTKENLEALPSTTFVAPKDLPTRSATVEPGATRSMYASRNTPHMGLPATPKAMRLVLDSNNSYSTVPVPPIPATFAQASPKSVQPSPDKISPKKEESLLTLLPSTVYSPPVRPPIARSMSAPPEEPRVPRNLQGGFSSGRGQGRKDSAGEIGQLRTVDDLIESNRMQRRGSHDDQIPPPPPPPPVLKQLQHLAIPPPPPPAPLAMSGGVLQPMVYGGPAKPSGMIEIVMDDDDEQLQRQSMQSMGSMQSFQQQLNYPPHSAQLPPPPPPAPVPVAIPVSEAVVPIIAPPAPPSSRNHQRGRSSTDNTLAGRISRATDRMRSASRSRTAMTKSPEISAPAPYESIPPLRVSFQAPRPGTGGPGNPLDQLRSPVDGQPPHGAFRTGLHESEMI